MTTRLRTAEENMSIKDISEKVTGNDSQESEGPVNLNNVDVLVDRLSITRSSDCSSVQMPSPSLKIPIRAATTHAFDKIFHAYDENFLPSKMYSKIIPDKHRRKSSIKVEDIKWMIHPHSQFKYVMIMVIYTCCMQWNDVFSADSFGTLL